MRMSKYGNALTILLVILIVAVIIGVGFLIYNYIIKPKINSDNAMDRRKQ